MRVEHSYPQMLWNETQWYVNCAHLEIKGPGGGTPGPMVKFPGAYDVWDPSQYNFTPNFSRGRFADCFAKHIGLLIGSMAK